MKSVGKNYYSQGVLLPTLFKLQLGGSSSSGIHMYILLNPPVRRVRDPFGYGNKKKEEEGYLYPLEGRQDGH